MNPSASIQVSSGRKSSTPSLLRSFLVWLGVSRERLLIPRRYCHFLLLPEMKLSGNALLRALSAQLRQLTGLQKMGFAYRRERGELRVWYWDEAKLAQIPEIAERNSGESFNEERFRLIPEPLSRGKLDDGLHLLKCHHGQEAMSIKQGQLCLTRWYAEKPSAEQWQLFVRDAGLDRSGAPHPHTIPVPENFATPRATAQRIPRGWRISSGRINPISSLAWGVTLAFALLGSAAIYYWVENERLDQQIQTKQQELTQLQDKSASLIAKQKAIQEQLAYLQFYNQIYPNISQTLLLSKFAQSGVFGEKTTLQEWAYQSGRLRVAIANQNARLSLDQLVMNLEKTGVFSKIELGADSSLAETILQGWVANYHNTEGNSEGGGQ